MLGGIILLLVLAFPMGIVGAVNNIGAMFRRSGR
jgi:hypothetical protein